MTEPLLAPCDWQSRLLDALWAPSLDDGLAKLGPAGAAQRAGLQAYRAHAAASAARALGVACPTVLALMGEAEFAALARQLWRVDPPQVGDLGRWGAGLPALIEGSDSLAPWPYLADMARLDLLCHAAERAPDEPFDADSWAALGTEPPERLALRLAPGLACLRSPHPLCTLWQAHHLADEPGRLAAWAELRAHPGGGESPGVAVLVWRQGWRARCAPIDDTAASFLARLLAGASLGQALSAAPALDFSHWLAQALQQGWCLGTRPHDGAFDEPTSGDTP